MRVAEVTAFGPPEVLRPASRTVRVRSDGATLRELARLLAAGVLRTRVARALPLADAAEGHRLVERGGLRGKVVLRP